MEQVRLNKLIADHRTGRTLEHHAEVLTGAPWLQRTPCWRDLAALLLVLGMVILLGVGTCQMMAPFVAAEQQKISLSPTALPSYTLRTIMRMLEALIASLIFAFTYATVAAKSRRAQRTMLGLYVLSHAPDRTLRQYPGTGMFGAGSRRHARMVTAAGALSQPSLRPDGCLDKACEWSLEVYVGTAGSPLIHQPSLRLKPGS